MSDKSFRDPLYNYIRIDKDRDSWLLRLLDTREVQRLRRIHQLGVSNYTYAGADHNRFAHTMGVLHLMQLVIEHLSRQNAEAVDGAPRDGLLAAAVLHDVGHGPFSHLFEPCLGTKHEKWSIAIVLDPDTEVNKVLRDRDKFLPQRVADLIDEDNHDHPAWQSLLLSSQLDVDRLDYLRRDSLFTGAGYGHFDWHRLLMTVEFYEGKDGDACDLVWPEKAALAIEEYVFARFYMYQNVYLHKTTRGFEQLLQAMWKRAEKLRKQGTEYFRSRCLPISGGMKSPRLACCPSRSIYVLRSSLFLPRFRHGNSMMINLWQISPGDFSVETASQWFELQRGKTC